MNEPSSARSSSGASCDKRRYLLSILSLGNSIAPNFVYGGRESSVLPRADQRHHPSKDGVAGASATWHIFVSYKSISADEPLRERRPCEPRRITLPRTLVNKGKKRIGASVTPPSSRVPLGYGHFFRPPGEVSLFCPGGHFPEDVVAGLPLPGPSLIAANATPDTDMLSAITTAAINNIMRFLIPSHPLSLIAVNTIGPRRDAWRGRHTLKPHPFCYVLGGGALSLGLSVS